MITISNRQRDDIVNMLSAFASTRSQGESNNVFNLKRRAIKTIKYLKSRRDEQG